MTAAQREYLQAKRIDPWSLDWCDARDVGFPEWGTSEAAILPDGRVLLANGEPHAAPAETAPSDPTRKGTDVTPDRFRIIAPLAYRGKEGCESGICTRMSLRNEDGTLEAGPCMGWHCAYCDQPCSSQGHRCSAAMAMIEAAEKIAKEQA